MRQGVIGKIFYIHNQNRPGLFMRISDFGNFPAPNGFLVMAMKRTAFDADPVSGGGKYLIKFYTNESTNRERIRFIQPGIRFY